MPRKFIGTLRYVNHRQFVTMFREIDGRGSYRKIGCKRGRRLRIRRAWAINQDSHDNEIQCFGTGCVRRVLSKAPIYLSYKTVWEQFAHKRHRTERFSCSSRSVSAAFYRKTKLGRRDWWFFFHPCEVPENITDIHKFRKHLQVKMTRYTSLSWITIIEIIFKSWIFQSKTLYKIITIK